MAIEPHTHHAQPPNKTRRRAAVATAGFLVFIVGCVLGWMSYSNNPPLFYIGLACIVFGGLAFLIFAIKWRNSRDADAKPQNPPTAPSPPAAPKLHNGSP